MDLFSSAAQGRHIGGAGRVSRVGIQRISLLQNRTVEMHNNKHKHIKSYGFIQNL